MNLFILLNKNGILKSILFILTINVVQSCTLIFFKISSFMFHSRKKIMQWEEGSTMPLHYLYMPPLF